MEASDMLDVIHYFYDEDSRYSGGYDEAKIVSDFRTSIYDLMYKKPYPYKLSSTESRTYDADSFELDDPIEEEEKIVPFNPRATNVKPYVPPTEFTPDSSKPFGSILDAPLE
jgi:hypothetical protein